MYCPALTFARNLPNAIVAIGSQASSHQSLLSSPRGSAASLWPTERHQSTKANNLKKLIPEFWIMKMKTAFAYHDIDGDGYITAKDFVKWAEHMEKFFPSVNEEKKKMLKEMPKHMWDGLLGGKGKGPDYKVTENMFIEMLFNTVNQEGAEDNMRKEGRHIFEVMDVNQDGVISKKEHRCFFEATENVGPNGAIVAFSAMDTNMDGIITCDEYVNAGVEFYFNFADETKPSKYFYGPLMKI